MKDKISDLKQNLKDMKNQMSKDNQNQQELLAKQMATLYASSVNTKIDGFRNDMSNMKNTMDGIKSENDKLKLENSTLRKTQ